MTWQFVFVSGFLLGRSYEGWKDRLMPRRWVVAILLLFIPLFALRFQQFLGFEYYPIFFEEFFRHFAGIEMAGETARIRSNNINGLKRMPVRLSPR